MINFLKKQSSYLYIIILSIILAYLRKSFYFYDKYIFSSIAIDAMISILFIFLYFKVYFDNYYNYVLNRTNIIVRIGRKKYLLKIFNKILINSIVLILINIVIDLLLTKTFNIIYILFNIIISALLVLILPKRKEYNYEFVIVICILLLLRIIAYNYIVSNNIVEKTSYNMYKNFLLK
jgi:hypothetical protein